MLRLFSFTFYIFIALLLATVVLRASALALFPQNANNFLSKV